MKTITTVNTLFEYLKSATLTQHQMVEQYMPIEKLRDGRLTKADYEKMILAHYHFHAGLEKPIALAFQKVQAPALAQFYQSHLLSLQQDMDLLNLEPIPVLLQLNKPVYQNVDELIGALYVLEGSRLGGHFIYKALKNNPQLSDIEQFHFFKGEGQAIGQRWKQFKEIGTALVENNSVCIKSAQKTFLFCESVFQQF